jgi:hypothetical protein
MDPCQHRYGVQFPELPWCARWYGWPLAPPERIAGAAGPLADLAALISPGREIPAVYDHDPAGREPARAVKQYGAGIEAAAAATTPASSLLRGGQAAYLLSASIRRPVNSPALPVLGRSRAARWSLSSALRA